MQLSPDYVPVENNLKMLTNDNVVSYNSANQTNLQDKEVSRQVGEDLPESREHYFDKQTNSNHSNSVAGEGPKVEESIKIRDLKSNVRQPLSSRSMKSFLSKHKSKHSRRSRVQVSQCLFWQVPIINVGSKPADQILIFRVCFLANFFFVCSSQEAFHCY